MNTKKLKTDVLVVGGGTSGVCAAIQAARMKVKVIVVEETPWLGGMLTAAGVSAIDGNHKLPSGLWGEFRQKLYDYYGGLDKVETGWVSKTLFEPRIGNQILFEMVESESGIELKTGYWLNKVIKDNDTVIGCEFVNVEKSILQISAHITIDCTEFGDTLAKAECGYRVGRESKSDFNEISAPEKGDEYVQDLTYVAILEEFQNTRSPILKKPAHYNAEIFKACCREWSDDNKSNNVSAKQMLDYGKLPNGKYMINWPNYGNDYFLNLTEKSREKRKELLENAKELTRGFIYFIQNELKFTHLGIAKNEFPTLDHFPLMPYIRESRRLKGLTTLSLNDVIDLYKSPQGQIYQQGIAVGNYPLDHHHGQNDCVENEEFPEISAFNVPYGCLVPKDVKGLLVAEKSISVTHIVNGCTRLQPVVMLIGQAAGSAAALCVKNDKQPFEINIRELQRCLLESNCWLMPFTDINTSDWYFQSAQKAAVYGLIRGESKSQNWVNQFYLYPKKQILAKEIENAVHILTSLFSSIGQIRINEKRNRILLADLIKILWQVSPHRKNDNNDLQTATSFLEKSKYFNLVKTKFHKDQIATRKEFVYLLDEFFNYFEKKETHI